MYQTKIIEKNECSIAVFMISLKSSLTVSVHFSPRDLGIILIQGRNFQLSCTEVMDRLLCICLCNSSGSVKMVYIV